MHEQPFIKGVVLKFGESPFGQNLYERCVLLIDNTQNLHHAKIINKTLTIFGAARTLKEAERYAYKYNDYCVHGDMPRDVFRYLDTHQAARKIKGNKEGDSYVQVDEIKAYKPSKRTRHNKGDAGGTSGL